MVLESILAPLDAEKRPDEMIIFGFIIASIGILLSLWVFPSYASFAMVTFTVMAVLPLMVKIMRFEKEKQEKVKKGLRIKIHKPVIYFFIFLFLGFLLAYTFWFLLLPTNVANRLFFLQINTITEINAPTGAAIALNASFVRIFFNNLRILALSFLFSFIFGSGAIFILSWNASVLGVAVANAIKLAVASGSGSAIYFSAVSFAFLRFLLHGIPEVTSYFLAGLAGGIISFAILDYKLGFKRFSKKFLSSLKGATMLIIFAIALLILSVLIEIFITPLFT